MCATLPDFDLKTPLMAVWFCGNRLAAELRGIVWVLLCLGHVIGVKKWGNFTGHYFKAGDQTMLTILGLNSVLVLAVGGWEAPLRADLFGFHVVRLSK